MCDILQNYLPSTWQIAVARLDRRGIYNYVEALRLVLCVVWVFEFVRLPMPSDRKSVV